MCAGAGAGDGRSEAARHLLAAFEAAYVEYGYIYSGCLPPRYIRERVFAGDADKAARAVDELLGAGLIVRRKCDALNYELTAHARLALIERHRLALVWNRAEAGRAFRPTARDGEITRVREAAGRGAAAVRKEAA